MLTRQTNDLKNKLEIRLQKKVNHSELLDYAYLSSQNTDVWRTNVSTFQRENIFFYDDHKYLHMAHMVCNNASR